LGDAISTGNQKVLLPVIDEEDADFSAVIGIDGPRGVYHPDTVLKGKARTWAHLCFKAWWKGDGDTRWDQTTLSWCEGDGFRDCRA
jgi:hypothetical protein